MARDDWGLHKVIGFLIQDDGRQFLVRLFAIEGRGASDPESKYLGFIGEIRERVVIVSRQNYANRFDLLRTTSPVLASKGCAMDSGLYHDAFWSNPTDSA